MPDNQFEIRNPLREKMASGKLAVGMISRLVRGVEIVAIAKTVTQLCIA
ncbi:hypothetical protein [Mameliella alba]|nr:hypothetical protein [Mameliella alba]MBV6634997.1 hypothetical protein [Mameliella sp.]